MLILDDISEEEDIPMEEDDKIECILCTHTNHSYLTRVLLYLTFVMECNDKPRMKESPTQADSERIVDILFPSFFTSDETLWNDEKHIYPKDTLLKEQKWKNNHKNAFMLFNYFLAFITILPW